MAHGTYNNPRAGSNGSKDRMQGVVDKVNDKYYKEITKKSGEVKQKPISQKKFERKAEQANKDVWDENPDNKVILNPQASYSPKGKTTKTKVIKKGNKPRKKTFVKETFETGKKEPTYQKGGYLQMPE